jgi:energy-coupling factor transporter transmembrane protein EcfT
MAAPSLFAYRAGAGLLHTLDPRAKLALVWLFSMTAAVAGWMGSILVTGLLLAGLRPLGISLISLLRAFRLFILFLGLIILTRALLAPGTPLIQVAGLSMSTQGLVQGSLTALRFFNMMVLGLIFSATTRPRALNAALQWLGRPIPFIPEKRMGTIFSLALTFLPMILRQTGESMDAFKARNGNRRKNPVRRTAILARALVNRVLDRADATAMAMASRCYTHNRTMVCFSPTGQETPVLLAGIALCAVLVFL